jgi:imidazolonepropionase-like amidohydrolase
MIRSVENADAVNQSSRVSETLPHGGASPHRVFLCPGSRTVELTAQAHRIGVRISVGTDSGNPAVFRGLAAHRELELIVRAGLRPLQALTAATAVVAAEVGTADRLGTVQAGKEADLVVLGASPIDDIRDTRSVELVVKRSELVNAAELAVV